MRSGSGTADRPLIGMLVTYLSDPYTQALIQGAHAEAVEAGANLLVYLLDGPNADGDGDPYAPVDPGRLDGLLLSPSLEYRGTDPHARLLTFLARCGNLPVQSVALDVPGVPSIAADGYTGMRAAVEHLLDHHDLTQIAFVSGPETSAEANERYRGYADAMRDHGLAFGESLVAAGDFSPAGGIAAAIALLGQVGDLQAIVCANDDSARGVLQVLQERGIRVPEQIAVVGFDDAEIALTLSPPLTTVRQPVGEIARVAVRSLLAAIGGHSAAPVPAVATELTVRRSCGCLPSHVEEQVLPEVTLPTRLLTYDDYRPEIVASLSDLAGVQGVPTDLGDLVDALWRDLKTEGASAFIPRVTDLLHRQAASDVVVWHTILSKLREGLVPLLGERRLSLRAEDLVQQARSLVDEARIHALLLRHTRLTQRRDAVQEFGAEATSAAGLDDVAALLAASMPALGVRHCCLAARQEVADDRLRLVISYHDGQARAHEDGSVVEPRELVPAMAWRQLPDRFTALAMPLFLGEETLGVALFEGDLVQLETYRWLRQSLSGAIYRLALSGAQIAARQLAERATSDAEAALRDALVAQRRYVEDSWHAYGSSVAGYGWSVEAGVHRGDEWLPVMTDAVQESRLVVVQDEGGTQSLGLPLKLLDEETIGVLGFEQAGGAQWTSDQLIQVVTIAHELSQLLETRRLVSDVERRAARLSAAAEVSAAATSVTDLDELLTTSVDLIRDRFGLTYAGIFLADDNGEWAVLVSGTGAAGETMLAQAHKLRIDEHSMIGYCIANATARVTVDTALDEVWRPNPLLPDVRSELALPLISRAQVIGAMTIQDNRPGAFREEDVTTLQTMANQLANAIQNARLMDRMEQNLREVQMATGQFTESAWRDYVQTGSGRLGYRHELLGTSPAVDRHPEADEALQRGESVVRALDAGGQGARAGLGVPIRLRNQTLGVVNLRFEDDHVPTETVQLVQQVADRLAVSLETARLLEVTQRTAQRERLVGELARKIRQSLEVDEVLQNSVREIRSAMDLYRVSLRLASQDPQQVAADSTSASRGLTPSDEDNGI